MRSYMLNMVLLLIIKTFNRLISCSGIPPSVATEKPEVKFELVNNTVENRQQLVFKCVFARVEDNKPLFYRVFWFINDYESAIYISKAVPFHQLDTTYLQNSTGLWKINLGVQVSSNIPYRFYTYVDACLPF